MDNLPEIRDIQLPDGVSFFPLAYGWWVILAVIVLSVIAFKLVLYFLRTSRKLYALKELKEISTASPVTAAIEMSELLRRICMVKYKEASVLYGQDWINFLNKNPSLQLSENAGKLLTYAPFMNTNDTAYERETAEELAIFCRAWIGANL